MGKSEKPALRLITTGTPLLVFPGAAYVKKKVEVRTEAIGDLCWQR
jgi:hypothetical protein